MAVNGTRLHKIAMAESPNGKPISQKSPVLLVIESQFGKEGTIVLVFFDINLSQLERLTSALDSEKNKNLVEWSHLDR